MCLSRHDRSLQHLSEVVEFLNGNAEIAPVRVDRSGIWKEHLADELDFEDVKGQEHARRAIEVAVAGGDNVLTLEGVSKPIRSRHNTMLPGPSESCGHRWV